MSSSCSAVSLVFSSSRFSVSVSSAALRFCSASLRSASDAACAWGADGGIVVQFKAHGVVVVKLVNLESGANCLGVIASVHKAAVAVSVIACDPRAWGCRDAVSTAGSGIRMWGSSSE